MKPGLLRVRVAAELLGVTSQTVRNRLRSGELAGVELGDRSWRVIASAIVGEDRQVVPPGPNRVDSAWVAEAWSVSRNMVRTLARDGVLPGLWRGGVWTFRRQDLIEFADEHTTGAA